MTTRAMLSKWLEHSSRTAGSSWFTVGLERVQCCKKSSRLHREPWRGIAAIDGDSLQWLLFQQSQHHNSGSSSGAVWRYVFGFGQLLQKPTYEISMTCFTRVFQPTATVPTPINLSPTLREDVQPEVRSSNCELTRQIRVFVVNPRDISIAGSRNDYPDYHPIIS